MSQKKNASTVVVRCCLPQDLTFALPDGRKLILQGAPVSRLVGMDGFVAMFQCAVAVYICWTLDTTVTNAMLVVALLGFISTVSVTRFRKRDN